MWTIADTQRCATADNVISRSSLIKTCFLPMRACLRDVHEWQYRAVSVTLVLPLLNSSIYFSLSHAVFVFILSEHLTVNFTRVLTLYTDALFNNGAFPQRRFHVYLILASNKTLRWACSNYPSAISNVLYCIIFCVLNFQTAFNFLFSLVNQIVTIPSNWIRLLNYA